tara:strand:+ start:1630 stop:1965 length:336 start_codon:yes stop_codon:yes gene_type:complete
MINPKKIKDELGRDYVLLYDNKTIIKKFRGDSNQIKSIYHIFGDLKNPRAFEIDFISKEGSGIVANYSSVLGFNFKMDGFIGFNSKTEMGIKFPVINERIKEWSGLLKNVK